MDEKLHEILMDLNRGRIAVDKAFEQIKLAMYEAERISSVVRLLPCPFCGGEGYLSKINKYSSEYTVVCKCCAAEGGWSKTISGAEMLWNTRQ